MAEDEAARAMFEWANSMPPVLGRRARIHLDATQAARQHQRGGTNLGEQRAGPHGAVLVDVRRSLCGHELLQLGDAVGASAGT
jgi:hypothetical protein